VSAANVENVVIAPKPPALMATVDAPLPVRIPRRKAPVRFRRKVARCPRGQWIVANPLIPAPKLAKMINVKAVM